MQAEYITWAGEATDKGRWGIYPYKTKGGGEIVFWMSEGEHDVYLAERGILVRLVSIYTDRNIRGLLTDIERYGDARAALAQQRERDHNNPDL